MSWAGKDLKDDIAPPALLWTGSPTITSAQSQAAHPTWPWVPPGMGHHKFCGPPYMSTYSFTSIHFYSQPHSERFSLKWCYFLFRLLKVRLDPSAQWNFRLYLCHLSLGTCGQSLRSCLTTQTANQWVIFFFCVCVRLASNTVETLLPLLLPGITRAQILY